MPNVFSIPRAHATERGPLRIQRATLATATTTLIAPKGDAPAAGQVRLTGDLLLVTTTSSYATVKLPTTTAMQDANAGQDLVIRNANASPKPLTIQNSAGSEIVTLAAGGFARINFNSTDGAVLVSTSTQVLAGALPAVDQSLYQHFTMKVAVAVGAGNTDIPGTLFPRNVEIQPDVRFLSDGPTGGTVQLKTAGGAAAITASMVPANQGIITNPASYTNANLPLAAGAGLRIVAGVGNPGGWMYISFRPV